MRKQCVATQSCVTKPLMPRRRVWSNLRQTLRTKRRQLICQNINTARSEGSAAATPGEGHFPHAQTSRAMDESGFPECYLCAGVRQCCCDGGKLWNARFVRKRITRGDFLLQWLSTADINSLDVCRHWRRDFHAARNPHNVEVRIGFDISQRPAWAVIAWPEKSDTAGLKNNLHDKKITTKGKKLALFCACENTLKTLSNSSAKFFRKETKASFGTSVNINATNKYKNETGSFVSEKLKKRAMGVDEGRGAAVSWQNAGQVYAVSSY